MLGTVNNGGETAVLFAESLGQNLDEFWKANAPIFLQVQGVSPNMTVGEKFKMSSSIFC